VAFGVAIAFTAGLGALVRSRGNAQSGGAVIAPRESASVTASAASSVPLVASAEPLVQDAGTAVEPDASAQAAPSASVRRTNPPPKRPVRPKFLSTPD
jgi:hypothetical protein